MTQAIADQHYAEHKEKGFFGSLPIHDFLATRGARARGAGFNPAWSCSWWGRRRSPKRPLGRSR
ncbi:MAG: hypothetical protein U1D30_05550 [Planctomycetota bacterium]